MACESEPVHLAIFDLYTNDRTSFDQVKLLRTRYPRIALVGYVAFSFERAQDMFDLARCGVDGIVVVGQDDDAASLRALIDRAEARSAAALLRPAVAGLPPRLRDAVMVSVTRAHERLSAETLCRRLATTRPALTRALREGGLPAPNQLLTWGRLIVAAHLLEEDERSAEGVAAALSFASVGAFRNTCRRYLGITPQEVRSRGGSAWVITQLLPRASRGPAAHPVPS
jgi:AraC-like DNA-binding protein